MSSARNVLANLALVLVSTLVGYLALEIAFFRLILPNIVGEFRPHLSETAEVIVQSTKKGAVPRNYIAILGDSYAEGIGDWLTKVGGNEALPFHSVHIIREQTGRDVVSFGKGGASSAEAMVRQPARVMAGSQCMVFPTIERPSRLVVYFYEGNDIQDNLIFLNRVRRALGRDDRAAIDQFLAEDYGQFSAWRCHLFFFDTFGRIVKYLYRLYAHGTARKGSAPTLSDNHFIVSETVAPSIADLQGPALEVSDVDMTKALVVFDRSLAWLRKAFNDVPISVTYIPSPLATYRLAGDAVTHMIEPAGSGRRGTAPAARVAQNSDRLCEAVRETAARYGVGFVNTRPIAREAAATEMLHGPLDWNHFNEAGYRLLGRIVTDRLSDATTLDECR